MLDPQLQAPELINDEAFVPWDATAPPMGAFLAPIPVPPLPPSKDVRQKIFDHAAQWMRWSRNYVVQKEARLLELKKLYDNDITYRQWLRGDRNYQAHLGESRRTGDVDGYQTDDSHRSDWLYSVGHIVDRVVTSAYSQIFEGPEWLVVNRIAKTSPEHQPQPSGSEGYADTPSEFSIALKVQHLVLQMLKKTDICGRIYDGLVKWGLDGTVFAKVFPWSTSSYSATYDPMTGKTTETKTTSPAMPVAQLVPPSRILPDPKARHSDIDRWSGIGHIVERTIPEIKAAFASGAYAYGEKEFLERWEDGAGGMASEDQLVDDPDAFVDNPDVTTLWAWEWHGSAPWSKDWRETTVSIITECDATTPEHGVLVKCGPPPLAHRPFATAQFYPKQEAFGCGLIERNRDLILLISEIVNQLQDNARVTAVASISLDQTSPAAQQIIEDGGKMIPGKAYFRRPGSVNDDPRPIDFSGFNAQVSYQLLDYFMQQLERRTLSETFLGQSSQRKTATEAQMLQQQSTAPVNASVHLFAQTFLTRVGMLALEVIKATVEEQGEFQLLVPNSRGDEVPVSITAAELQDGEFVVEAALTRQDSTRIAKASTLTQILNELPNLTPMLQQQGWVVDAGELFIRLLDCVNVDGSDRICRKLSTNEEMLIQQNQQLQQQIMMLTQPPPPNAPGPPAGPGGGQPSGPPPGPPSLLEGGAPPPPPMDMGPSGPMGASPEDVNSIAKMLQMQQLMGQGGLPGGIPEL